MLCNFSKNNSLHYYVKMQQQHNKRILKLVRVPNLCKILCLLLVFAKFFLLKLGRIMPNEQFCIHLLL